MAGGRTLYLSLQGEEFYRIKALNLDIRICSVFRALSLEFNLGIAEPVPSKTRNLTAQGRLRRGNPGKNQNAK
jgi:hypothetical protein